MAAMPDLHLPHPRATDRLIHVPLDQLRPTQMTVGMAEVEHKRAHWASLGKKQRREAMASHCFPVVLGPGPAHFVVDHHHLGLALIGQGVEQVPATVLDDLSYLAQPVFWRVMEMRNWAHPFDRNGRRRDADAIPARLQDLVDDPHRSLAGFLRAAGGFAKDAAPFAEFLWADHLRPLIPRRQIRASMDDAVREAMGLARSPLARYLPGWTGVAPSASAPVR